MNNMYDILAKMKLLEGKGSKPDFLDLDKDGNRTEPMKSAAKEVDEASYSAKSARAGKDIGKPGKAFAQIAKTAGERYGSKERGEKVAGAVLAKLRAKEGIENEGNKFTGNLAKARAAGKDMADLDGDGDMEKVLEREYYSRDDFDDRAKPGDTYRTEKGTLTKTSQGVRHERRADDEDTDDDRDDDTPKRRGRPKGTKRALGAKGPTGKSKLMKKDAIKEGDLEEDYDKDEYDEEGEMAMSQASTIEDAAEELQSILDADENLPEWVQKKITLAKEYIDSARDYLKANRPEDDGMVAEKAVSKAQRAAAGIAYAAKKGDLPKSELRSASKEMAKMPAGELKKFAKTKEKGLPEKKKEESVEETTVAGSVATAPAEDAKGKKGMVFGKGVYEGQIAESFEKKLKSVLTEGISINASQGENGEKSLTINATDEDAVKLAQILKLAGMPQGHDYHDACPVCGQEECGCEGMAEGEYANSPDVEEGDTDMMVNGLAGGLNGPKLQVNPNNPADNPLAMRNLGQHSSPNLNLGPEADKKVTETRLWDLYKKYERK